MGYPSDEEHSVLEDDSDGEEREDYIEDDDGSSSLSIPNESIDFDLVYALHSFAATVEGQANVVKGDSLFLMDDSNSYWWLVRVLKTQEVGYIPAENIETPFERLARLNKHRNVDVRSVYDGYKSTNNKTFMNSWLPPRTRNYKKLVIVYYPLEQDLTRQHHPPPPAAHVPPHATAHDRLRASHLLQLYLCIGIHRQYGVMRTRTMKTWSGTMKVTKMKILSLLRNKSKKGNELLPRVLHH